MPGIWGWGRRCDAGVLEDLGIKVKSRRVKAVTLTKTYNLSRAGEESQPLITHSAKGAPQICLYSGSRGGKQQQQNHHLSLRIFNHRTVLLQALNQIYFLPVN